LTAEQWDHVQALAVSLSSQQLAWLSGYFAGYDDAARQRSALPALAAAGEDPAPWAAQRTITILFGSETGNSAELAKDLDARLRALGRSVTLVDMGDYKLRRLKAEQDLLIITSTHGEGDPPQAAADFFEFVESRKAPCWPWVIRLTSATARRAADWIDVWRSWGRPAFVLGPTVTSTTRTRRRSGSQGSSPPMRPTLQRAQEGRPPPSTPNPEHLRGSDQRRRSFSTSVILSARG
jgi:hypothetical protein